MKWDEHQETNLKIIHVSLIDCLSDTLKYRSVANYTDKSDSLFYFPIPLDV